MDAIGIVAAHIYGTSLGGMIAQEFALRHPHKVKCLVLTATCCIGSDSILSEFADLVQSHDHSPPAMSEAILRLFITEAFINSQPDVFQQIVAFTKKHQFSQKSLNRHLQAISSHNTCDRLPEISAPPLVLAGGADRITSVEKAEVLTANIPNAELIVFNNAGHMLVEAGNTPHQIVLKFLSRCHEPIDIDGQVGNA